MFFRKITQCKAKENKKKSINNRNKNVGHKSIGHKQQNLADSNRFYYKNITHITNNYNNTDLSTTTQKQLTKEALMEHRHKLRPIQLFVPASSNPNILRLNKAALNTVLGHSSIANRKYSQKNDSDMDWLQDESQLEGFHYRSGAKRDTVGIWIWAEPIMIDAANGERYAVVLMDTQGCFEQPSNSQSFSTTNSSTTNNLNNNNNNNINNSSNYGVLALSTILSCYQFYNMSEIVPEEALQALKFFTDYEKLCSLEAPQFGKPFQHLMFVIRDSKLSDELVYGIDGGNKLLEKVLSVQKENNILTKKKSFDEIRINLTKCFQNGLSAYLLPHPGPKVADSNQQFRGNVKDIKPIFRDEIRRLIEALISPIFIKPKLINGKEITEYGKIFESPELPNSRALLNVNLHLSCVEHAFEAKLAYCRGMDRATRSSRMMAEKKLLESHIKHGVKALNIYDRCPKIESGDIRYKNLAKLQEDINHELERYKHMNEEKRVTTCASAMLACGDSPFFGLGLGGAASGAVAVSVVTLQMGIVSAGIVAIPVSLGALFGIWVYVTLKPSIRVCFGMERDS